MFNMPLWKWKLIGKTALVLAVAEKIIHIIEGEMRDD